MPHAQITEVTTFEPCKPKEQTILLSIPDCPSMSLSIKLPISRPCEGAAPTTKSETVPGPFRTRLRESAPACVKASQPRWCAHCPEAQFTHRVLRLPRNSNLAKPSRGRANGPVSATASASCYPLARREWIQHLAKVLRLPRNLHSTLRKCCACHEIYT